MTTSDLAGLVETAAYNADVARDLRREPRKLRTLFGLSDADVRALRSANAFFPPTQPVLAEAAQGERSLSAAVLRPRAATTLTADTGTLRPGQGSGSATASASSGDSGVPTTSTVAPQPPTPP